MEDMWLPEKVQAAVDSGGDYESNPYGESESYTFGLDTVYMYDDDKDWWSSADPFIMFDVHGGDVFAVVYYRYECGDIEPEESIEISCRDDFDKVVDAHQQESEESKKRYIKWVAKTGKDPYRFFSVRREVTINETWEFQCTKFLSSIILDRARLDGEQWMGPYEIPERVRDYLLMKSGTARILSDDVDPACDWDWLMCVDEVLWTEKTENNATGIFNIDHVVKLDCKNELKALARKEMQLWQENDCSVQNVIGHSTSG